MPQPSKMAEGLEGMSEQDVWALSHCYRQAPIWGAAASN
jgi:hypothetical protein